MRPATEVPQAESQVTVAIVGLVSLMAITIGLLYAMALGWVAVALLGIALLAVAWFVPTTTSARSLRYMFAMMGALALLVAIYDLFT